MINLLSRDNLIAGGLALLAAFLFAIAFVVQQRAAGAVSDRAARGTGLIRRLIRRPLWWYGVLADTGGYGLQAAALWLGAMLLVQPLLVTSMLFALPLGARWAGRQLSRRDWTAAGVLVLALAAFIVLGTPTEGIDQAPWSAWVWPAIGLISVIVGCLLGAAVLRRTPRALLLGVVTGVLYGITAALTKPVTNMVGAGLGTLLTSWELYALIVAAIGGTLIQQSAFQAGSLGASLPALTVLDPLVAALLGIVIFQERLRANGPEWVLIGLSVLLMVAGTIALAHSAAQSEIAAHAAAGGRSPVGAGTPDGAGAPPTSLGTKSDPTNGNDRNPSAPT